MSPTETRSRYGGDDGRPVPEILTLQEGLELHEVEQRVGLAEAGAGLRHRVSAFYFSDVDRRGIHRLAGFRSVAQWAAQRFGMSRREARDLLAVGNALRELSEINRAFADGRLFWSKLRELVKVATADTEKEWLEYAVQATTDELILEVRLSKKGDRPRRDSRKGLPEPRLRADFEMPPDVYAKWQQLRRRIRDSTDRELNEWECFDAVLEIALASQEHRGAENSCYDVSVTVPAGDDGTATVETDEGPVPVDELTATLLACDAGCPCREGDEKSDQRMPPALRRRVLRRDRRRCQCCGSRYSLQAHHIVAWSGGGRSVMENLVTVCRWCHALIHAGLLAVEGPAPQCRFHGRDDEPRRAALPRHYGLSEKLAVAPPKPDAARVPLEDVPAVIDGAWWRRHAHLLKPDGRGGFELLPGRPREADAPQLEPAAAREHEVGTRCQLRPRRLVEVVGQRRVVAEMRGAVRAARASGEPMSHVLLQGPPGLGKTSIARAAAAELGVSLHAASGALLGSRRALVNLLIGLGECDVLFIDEIHALPAAVAETLYEAIEDRRLSILLSCGQATRVLKLALAPFTLIGATTHPGLLPRPFVDRFVYRAPLAYYDTRELARIVAGAAPHFGVAIESQAAELLGNAARGTPRLALALLKRACDDAVVRGSKRVTAAGAEALLKRSGIDDRGLGPVDRRILEVLGRDGPVGILRLAQLTGVDVVTLEREHEPYLVHQGLVAVTPRGRALAGSGALAAA